ncbi:MAG: hypothetical protein ABEI78_02480, partial [Candidatus Nanohaloarchaea archaeon]
TLDNLLVDGFINWSIVSIYTASVSGIVVQWARDKLTQPQLGSFSIGAIISSLVIVMLGKSLVDVTINTSIAIIFLTIGAIIYD